MKRRPAEYRKACAEVNYRSAGMCEANIPDVCPQGMHRAQHHHHLLLVARGGADEASNLLHVCHLAHDFIHANPRWATEHGFMRSRGAA